MQPMRTLLFAPGNKLRVVEKALGLDADAVVLDLEDAVAISEKAGARGPVLESLQGPRRVLGYVRVNAPGSSHLHGDLEMLVAPGVDGLMLPKVETAAALRAIDQAINDLEHERGLPPGAIDLLPIIETARGLAAARDIAVAGTRTRRFAFGAGDYTLDLGLRWTRSERELDHARSELVLASRLGGLEAPIDTVFTELGEIDALVSSAELARDMGFQGKLCIHPEQLAPVNAVFTPTSAELARARRCVAAFERAEAAGNASIQVDGRFVDYPIYEQSRRIVALAAAIAMREAQ